MRKDVSKMGKLLILSVTDHEEHIPVSYTHLSDIAQGRVGCGIYTADVVMRDNYMVKDRISELVRNIGGNPDDVNAANAVRVAPVSYTHLTRALDGVTLSIEKGEFVAIVGTSGSGKSTLLNMIGGLDVPTSGQVVVDGKELSKLKDEELTVFRRRKIGFIFQNYNLCLLYTSKQAV